MPNWCEQEEKIIRVRLIEGKTCNADIGNLECSLCDKTFVKNNETYYDLNGEEGVMAICKKCVKDIEIEG